MREQGRNYRLVIILIFLLLFCSIVNGMYAADLTWIGGGEDNLASSPANWSDNIVPQNGDRVVFDNTSTKNCIWDITPTLVSFSIHSGYTGAVTLNATNELRLSDTE